MPASPPLLQWTARPIQIHASQRPKRRRLRLKGQTSVVQLISEILFLLMLIVSSTRANLELPNIKLDSHLADSNNGDRADDCEACVSLVKSFEKGLDRTNRGKHEGGDTSWEEKNLKSYADSEVRLVEIQDDLCDDVTSNKAQCLSMAETGDQYIEEWWFEHRKKNVRLHDYLCINKLKKCCPEDTFGPTCQKCTDCYNHGKCDGSGTRGGSGKCNCNQGYKGDYCDECDNTYYVSRLGGDGKFECIKCHKACLSSCSGPTSANCTACGPGYARDAKTNLCEDINECELGPGGLNLDSNRLCKDGTYCENTDGHYRCSPCHYVCQTCLDYGRDKCLTCASDHHMDANHTCIHFSEQIADESGFAYYSYLTIECMGLLTINIGATILTHYLLRRYDLLGDAMAGSFLRLSLILPIALMTGHVNLFTSTRSSMTHLHKSVMSFLGVNETIDPTEVIPSTDAHSNISLEAEL